MRSIDRSHHWRKSFSLHLSDVSIESFSLTRGRFLGSSGAIFAAGLTVLLLPRLFERELERACFFFFFFFLFFLSSDESEVEDEEALRFLPFLLFFPFREELDELLDDELEGDESESPGSLYLTFRLRFMHAVLMISPESDDSSSVPFFSFLAFLSFFLSFFFLFFCFCY